MSVLFADGQRVDVLDRECEFRPCLWIGFDKGTYVQGRGYTSYYDKPRVVCWTRHLHGCPHPRRVVMCSACGHRFGCRAQDSPLPALPPACLRCGSPRLYWRGEVPDPEPCCDAMAVAPVRRGRRVPTRQKCRGCGRWLQGWRLARARGGGS